MSKKLVHNYTFTPASNKIVIDDVIRQERFLLITNMEDGQTIYTFNSPTASFASYTLDTVNKKTTIVLNYNCSSMSSTDNLQIFIEHDGNLIQPVEAYTDPVSKLRVSNPQNLIDTDFEYGLQSTKWETIELVKNIPTFFSRDGDTGYIVSSIDSTSGSKEITVTVSEDHDLSIGAPIIVIGTNLNLANGGFVVKSAPTATSFTYMSKGTATTTGTISNSATEVYSGSIYQGTEFKLDGLDAIATDGDSMGSAAGGSTLTVKTKSDTSFNIGTSFYMTNSLGARELSFNAANIHWTDSGDRGLGTDSSNVAFTFAHDSALTGHRRSTGIQPYWMIGASETVYDLVKNTNLADPKTLFVNPEDITLDQANNKITIANHGLVNRQAYYFEAGLGNKIGDIHSGFDTAHDSAGVGIFYAKVIDNNSFRLSKYNPVTHDSSATYTFSSNTIVNGLQFQSQFIPTYRIAFTNSWSDYSAIYFEQDENGVQRIDSDGQFGRITNPGRPPNWMWQLYYQSGAKQAAACVGVGLNTSEYINAGGRNMGARDTNDHMSNFWPWNSRYSRGPVSRMADGAHVGRWYDITGGSTSKNGYHQVRLRGTASGPTATNYWSTSNWGIWYEDRTDGQGQWMMPIQYTTDFNTVYANNHGLKEGEPFMVASKNLAVTGHSGHHAQGAYNPQIFSDSANIASTIENVTTNSFEFSDPYNRSGSTGNYNNNFYTYHWKGITALGANSLVLKKPVHPIGQTAIDTARRRSTGNTDIGKIPISNHNIPEGATLLYNRNGGTAVGGLTDLTTYYNNVADTNNIRLGTAATIIYPAGYNKRTGVQGDTKNSYVRRVYTYSNGHNFILFNNYSTHDALMGFQNGDIVQYLYNSQPIRGLVPGAFYYLRALYNTSRLQGHFQLIYYASDANVVNMSDLMSAYWQNNHDDHHAGIVPLYGSWNNSSSPIGDFRHTSIIPFTSAGTGTQILQDTTVGAADGVYSVDSSTDAKTYTLKAGAKIPKRTLSVIGNQKIDTTNDAILFDDHGLETGTSVVYSTTGIKVTGLDSDTTYYAINSGKDHFKLATSSTNAEDGTAINLTNATSADNQVFTVNAISGQSKGPGTVSATANKKVITGSSTLFQSKYSPGDTIKIDIDKTTDSVPINNIVHGTETFTTNASQGASWVAGLPLTFKFGGSWPAGLEENRIYYLGSIATNDFKVYPTDSDAIAGTNVITISSNGTGSKSVLHTIDFERYKTGTIKHVNNNTSLELENVIDSDVSADDYLVQSSFLMRADGFALHRPYDGGVELIPSTNPDGQMIRQTRRYFRYQSGKGIQNSLAINFSPSTDVDTFAADSSVGTITTRYAHRLSTGLYTTFRGATVASGNNLFNESLKVISTPTDNTFTVKFDQILTLDSSHTGLTVGETITQTGTGATGLVRGDSSTVPGSNLLQLYDVEGTFHAADSAGHTAFGLTGSTKGNLYQHPKSKVIGPASSPAGGIITYSVDAWQNSTLRAGLFDDQNGLFWEYDGSTLYAVVRSSTQQISGFASVTFGSQEITGSNTKWTSQLSSGDKVIIKGQTYKIVTINSNTSMTILPSYRGLSLNNCILTKTIDNKVPQSEFNLDKADGTGPTGFVFDKTKIQMSYIDYSWYGAGKVRFGFKDQNGDVQYMHQFVHNNSFTEAFMRSGNVPGRYEIENIGTPTYVPALAHWGTSIIMDGKFDDDKAYIFTASGTNLTLTGASSVTMSARPFHNWSTGYYYATIPGSGKIVTLGRALEIETPSATLNEVTAGTSVTSATGTGGLGSDSSAEAADPYRSFSSYGGALTNSGPYQPAVNVEWYNGSSWQSGIKNLLLINEDPSSTKSQYQTYTLGLVDQAATPLTAEYPLISIRLSPSVDTNAPGLLGEREVINRMQLALKQVGILSTHGVEIQLRMNGSIDNNDWQRVTTPSLSQLVYHTSTDTITGGNTIYSFRAQGGTGTTNRTAVLTDQDISEITFLGNSILGGDNVFPDGPDILTIVAVLAEDVSSVSASNPWTISGRVSWAESQA